MTAALSLFDAPRPLTAAERKADVEAWLERLVPLARDLAVKAGTSGVTVADLRHFAEDPSRGLMTGAESRTRGSYLGQVMRRAGLVETGQYRRSTVAKSHRNLHAVWVAPEFARAA